MDALLVVEKGDATAPERESLAEDAGVGQFVSVLGLEQGEAGETGRPDVLVALHAAILVRRLTTFIRNARWSRRRTIRPLCGRAA